MSTQSPQSSDTTNPASPYEPTTPLVVDTLSKQVESPEPAKADPGSYESDSRRDDLPTVNTTHADTVAMNQMRELLFGDNNREWERRFGRLETVIDSAVETLRREIASNAEAIHQHVRCEMESIQERITSEQANYEIAAQRTQAKVDSNVQALDDRVVQLRAALNETASEVRREIDEANNSHSAALREQAKLLQDVKVDRSTLASLFDETAKRLASE